MTVETNNAEKEFVFEDWLTEGVRAMRARAHERKHKVVPEEFCAHMRTARKELLLAFRSLIDEAVKQTEPESPKKATKIKVE